MKSLMKTTSLMKRCSGKYKERNNNTKSKRIIYFSKLRFNDTNSLKSATNESTNKESDETKAKDNR